MSTIAPGDAQTAFITYLKLAKSCFKRAAQTAKGMDEKHEFPGDAYLVAGGVAGEILTGIGMLAAAESMLPPDPGATMAKQMRDLLSGPALFRGGGA